MRRRMLILWLVLAVLVMCAAVPLASLLVKAPADTLNIRLYRVAEDRLEETDFFAYLTGCVASCLTPGTDYPDAALTAIAAATQGKLLSVCGRCSHAKAKSADFCDDPNHGSGYLSPDEAAAVWGTKADALYSRIQAAIREIRGFGVCSEGQLALTLTHESSYLLTESAESLLGQSIPYLRSVRSYEEAPIREISMEKSALRLLLQSGFGVEDADPEILSRTDAGRVAWVALGDKRVSGSDFADLLMLPSADFDMEDGGDCWRFTVRGEGSGIGLSRMGAVAMAAQGYGFRQILAAYYPGTEFLPIDTARLLALGREIRDS